MAENTRLRDLQATVTRHADELHRLTQTMNNRFNELDEHMAQIQMDLHQILHNTSHNGGSPLNSLSTNDSLDIPSLPIK